MPRIVMLCVPLLASLLLVACGRKEEPAAEDPFEVTQAYVEDFVRRETGDAALAEKLGADGRKAWQGALQGLRDGRSARDVAAALTEQGLNVVLLSAGSRRFELPGRTVSVLLMDVDNGCSQIVHERWVSAEPDGPARVALIGIGRQDVDAKPTVEKKIHLMAFELPAAGDYLDTRTNSLSPFGKIIIGFGAIIGLTGCTNNQPPAPAPLVANFQINPNPTATADRPGDPAQVIKEGFWDASTMSISYRESQTRVWTSVTRSFSGLAALDERGVPGNTVQVWLTDADRVKISGITPMGAIDDDGRRATARTDMDGKVHVTIERLGVVGDTSATLWGTDPAHNATKSVTISMPDM